MILIVGSGALARAAVPLLLERGHTVRVMARTPDSARDLEEMGAEVVQGDLLDPDSVRRALQGADRVLTAAHSVGGAGTHASENVDVTGHQGLVDAAREAGVQHFVHTSAFGARADSPVDFFRNKAAAEEYVKASGLSYTILQPSAFFTPHADMIGGPLLAAGETTIPGRGENPRNFVAPEDVAKFAVLALEDPRAAGETIVVAGPENLTANEVAEIYARAGGVEPRISYQPLPPMPVEAVPANVPDPVQARFLQMAILNDTVDQSLDPGETLQRYPVELTSLEGWLRERLSRQPASRGV